MAKRKKVKKPQNDTTYKGKSRYALKVRSGNQMYGIQRQSSKS